MSILDRKLRRDLWTIRGQGLAIALVIAAGIAMFITYRTNFLSLRTAQSSCYERQRFAQIFASLERAPTSLIARIARIPGVAHVEARVVIDVTLDVAGLAEPATGRLISVPIPRRSVLNDVELQEGRYLEPHHENEVLVSQRFADANGLGLGDSIEATINGTRRQLRIVGMALSPEYIASIRPGQLVPDDRRFGIMWMAHDALATAHDMKGAFNDVSLSLERGASSPEVIARLDDLLENYGGLGAMSRDLQLSHWLVDMELKGLESAGFIVPLIFLSVAAFLLNVVMMRIVTVQREQIAALKALGRTNWEIGLHYTKWSLVIAGVGSVLGILAGAYLGRAMLGLYDEFYRFPGSRYLFPPKLAVFAVAAGAAAALLGAFMAVRRAVSLQPAEAMRPEAPTHHRRTLLEWLFPLGKLSQPSRMILRNLSRQPVRTATSVVGIACAAAMLVVGLFFIDSLAELEEVQFHVAQRQDVTVTFRRALSGAALHSLTRLPGVQLAEPQRIVHVRLSHGHRVRQTAVTALAARPRLQRIINSRKHVVPLPEEGLVMSTKLAEILDVKRGDAVYLEVLEGARPTRRVIVSQLVDEYMGTSLYMERAAMARLLREEGSVTVAALQVEASQIDRLYTALKDMPSVAGVDSRRAAIASFRKTLAQNINIMIVFNVGFASVIAFGVIYNAARVSLSERSRELASLRVLGFTRGEISYILLGELAAVTLMAIPLGLMLGYQLAALVCWAYDTELYRFPLLVGSRTYAGAVLVVMTASVLSGAVVRRRLDQLDLIAVLKTRE